MIIPALKVNASDELYKTANTLFESHDYYQAITELKRYQLVFPEGEKIKESYSLLSWSYFNGNNYSHSIETLEKGEKLFPAEDRYVLQEGFIRLQGGSPLFAERTFSRYLYMYPESKHRNRAELYKATAMILGGDHAKGERLLRKIISATNDPQLKSEAESTLELLKTETNRSYKNKFFAVSFSLLIPGFGQFYTGHYLDGFFTFATNALLISAAVYGFISGNFWIGTFASIMELSFYQNSIVSAVRLTDEFNSHEPFYSKLKMNITFRY